MNRKENQAQPSIATVPIKGVGQSGVWAQWDRLQVAGLWIASPGTAKQTTHIY